MSRVLSTDLYQLTMAAGYFHRGMKDAVATCEMFVRRLPTARRYLVALGIDDVLDYLEALRFDADDIAFMREIPALAKAMTPGFVDYLRGFRFSGAVEAVREGTVMFAAAPFLRVRAPIIEAQLVETFALSALNHATMVGSKAARVVCAAAGRTVVEFGSRRTHPEAAIDAARAAYAAGFAATSNVEAARRWGIPVMGTAAHMWTMAHPSEEQAFAAYGAIFPEGATLLIDTYDTPRGAERAARALGAALRGVRIDSGDLGALARVVRGVLDREGAPQAKIVASGDLNEHSISALLASGAPIDTFGVGTELVCSVDAPALGGVYKLVELEQDGARRPIAKFSEGKGTLPGPHQVLRRFDAGGRMVGDLVALADEPAPEAALGERSVALLEPALADGRRTRPRDALSDVRARVAAGLVALPPALHDLAPRGPSEPGYPVEISKKLAALQGEVKARFVEEAQR